MFPFFYEEYRDREDAKIAKFKLDLSFNAHTHKAIEIAWCVEKQIDVIIENKKYTLYPGDVCFVNSMLIHEFVDHGKNVCVIIPPRFCSEYEKLTLNKMPVCPIIKKDNPHIGKLIEALGDENTKYSISNTLVAHSIANLILGRAMECLEYVDIPNEQVTKYSVVHNFVTYINSHYKEDLNLDTIASALGYNKYYLSSMINKFLRMNFKEYLNSVRLMKFRKKYNPPEPIDVVASRCGFTSRQTFYRVFKQTFGLTPTEFFSSVTQNNFISHSPVSQVLAPVKTKNKTNF